MFGTRHIHRKSVNNMRKLNKKGTQMKFIKNHIFDIARFLNIWLALFNIYDLAKQQSTVTSAVFNIVVSILSVIVICVADLWYNDKWDK